MDQFGWSEEETVLYFGILIASASVLCVFLFAIGKISISNFLFNNQVEWQFFALPAELFPSFSKIRKYTV